MSNEGKKTTAKRKPGMKKAAAIMGMAAMAAMADPVTAAVEFDEMDSMIPQSGLESKFYSIGKTPMTAIQKVKRKRSKLARKARKHNR